MFKSSGNNRNHAPVKDNAGHIVNKAGYNNDLVEQKIRRRAAETSLIFHDESIETLELLLKEKGKDVNKKLSDEGKLIDTEMYFRKFSTTDRFALRELIKQKVRKQAEESKKSE